ncbi:MAG: transglycosylase SLT domain-containing protein [Candidatus Kapabacteria bacterium]|nr:transglycosylase SLT domain-containing protein [Candidatus Kapabacteria bacterium]
MTVQEIITAVAKENGINPALMLTMARIESNFNPNAVNRSSRATGLFQFLPMHFESGGYGLTPGNVKDPRINSQAAAKMIKNNIKCLEGKGIKVMEDWQVYLAHQQGCGGASALLSRRGQPLSALPSNIQRNVRANIGNRSVSTVDEFLNLWKQKFDGFYAQYSTGSNSSSNIAEEKPKPTTLTPAPPLKTDYLASGLLTFATILAVSTIIIYS